MRKIFILIVTLYQYTASPIFKILFGTTCRYEVSCSEYAKKSIKEFGVYKGGILALRRLLSCQPFATIRQ